MKFEDFSQNAYQAFRQERHEAMKAPIEVLNFGVEKATGSRRFSNERIIKGETNEVHAVTTEEGREIFVRIYQGNNPTFKREQWAMRESAKAGVPVPDILLLDSIEADGRQFEVCVESKIPGKSLDELFASKKGQETDPALQELLRQAGDILSRIHSRETEGFGKIDQLGNWPYHSIQEVFLNDKYTRKEKMLAIADVVSLEKEIILEAYDIFEKEVPKYPHVTPHLIHGDITPEHIFVDNGKISGIIDFGNAAGMDPIVELARWDYMVGTRYPLNYIREGYGNQKLFDSDFDSKFQLWMLYRALHSLRYCADVKKEIGIEKAKHILIEEVEYFAR